MGLEQRPGQIGRLIQRVATEIKFATTSPEDAVWNPYMEYPQNSKSLIALVTNKESPLIVQQRAMEVLLAPDVYRFPFKVNVDPMSGNNLRSSKLWIEKVTEEQANFVADRIPRYIKRVKRENAGNLFYYNNLIPKLLAKLTPENAEKLFESFNINDPLPFFDMDRGSGYNPLNDLYFSNVDESWKLRAADRIHKIIQSEQNGKTKPRAEWEVASKEYSRILREIIISNEMPVSKEFCRKEIIFMLDIPDFNIAIAGADLTNKVLNLLGDNNLRIRFANNQRKYAQSK